MAARVSLVLLVGLLSACGSGDGKSDDADGDGVPASEDCDDGDPSLGARSQDADCDGATYEDDCDDASPSSPVRSEDGDCDGIPTAADCDDTNDQKPLFDQDCDDVESGLDCNDADASLPAADADCDGVLTADDCDDDNALLGDAAQDADCDGATTAVDCDDANPGVGDITQDADCDGVRTSEDCDDANDAMPVGDEDCDGIPAEEDCSDFDPDQGAFAGDTDCDGLADEHDCDPTDTTNAIDIRTDADCDGVPTTIDCDDGDATVVATNEDDADCDGIVTADDCAPEDPTLPTFDDVNCDGVLNHPGLGDMILISAGTFDMGYRGTETCRSLYTSPPASSEELHEVTLTRDFYISETEVTHAEWEPFAATSYRYWTSCTADDCPTILFADVSEVFEYLNALSADFGYTECYAADATTGVYIPIANFLDCDGYRLPTDAEWEYAARCGEEYEFAGSDTWSDVARWMSRDADSVAQKDPNACGLYDMSGNASELVNDLYVEDAYEGASSTDPLGTWPWDPSEDEPDRVIRGGDFDLYGTDTSGCQVALHLREDKTRMGYYDGVRIVRTAPSIP